MPEHGSSFKELKSATVVFAPSTSVVELLG
jgi:hypothetical protein